MIITSFISHSHISYRIRANEKSPEIIVSKNKKMLSEGWTGPTINWPGCGDMDLSQTSDFVDALKTARWIAVRLRAGVVPEETLEFLRKMDMHKIL